MPTPKLHLEGPKKAKICVALAHGAGEGWDSRFLDYFANGLADLGYRVARFEFPYMAERATTGRRRPPDREEVLRACWLEVIQSLPSEHIVIGGKSMGGRIASLIADESQAESPVGGLVCLGYPFHPSGKPEKLRVEHLAELQTPTLIVQGEIDPFGSRDEVLSYNLSDAIELHWVPDGDHSYKTRRGSDRSQDQNFKNALRAIDKFIQPLWPELMR
ncbi:MAG: dienelactone hydrolase family protein [Planctomycetaceae bacterium]|nr:dienelactone hydrolase family protein [Planctomycetaceae bacterium]